MSFNALLRYEDVFDPKSGSILKANGHRGGFNVEPIRGNVLTKVEERSELRRRCGSSSRLVPQNASDPGYPRIALHLERESVRVAHRAELVELALGRGPHRAELPHREGSPADADPPLAEERTAGRIETNREHAHREERGRKEQQDDTGAEIEGALDQSGRRVQLDPFQRNDRAVPDGCTRSRDARYSSRPGATSTRAGHARTYSRRGRRVRARPGAGGAPADRRSASVPSSGSAARRCRTRRAGRRRRTGARRDVPRSDRSAKRSRARSSLLSLDRRDPIGVGADHDPDRSIA